MVLWDNPMVLWDSQIVLWDNQMVVWDNPLVLWDIQMPNENTASGSLNQSVGMCSRAYDERCCMHNLSLPNQWF